MVSLINTAMIEDYNSWFTKCSQTARRLLNFINRLGNNTTRGPNKMKLLNKFLENSMNVMIKIIENDSKIRYL